MRAERGGDGEGGGGGGEAEGAAIRVRVWQGRHGVEFGSIILLYFRGDIASIHFFIKKI